MKKLRLWGGLLALFLSGVLMGAVGTRVIFDRWGMNMLEGPRPPMQRLILKRLDRELNLDEEQERRIEEILRQGHREMMELRRKHEPEIKAVLHRGINAMKSVLSLQQQEKLDAFVERERARRAKRERSLREDRSREREP